MLIDSINIPRTKESQTCNSCNLRIFRDLKNKAVLFLLFFILFWDHKGVLGETSVDKGIDIDTIERRILDLASFVIFFKMNFEDFFGLFGIMHLQIFS